MPKIRSGRIGSIVPGPQGGLEYRPPQSAKDTFTQGITEGSQLADKHITKVASPAGKAVGYAGNWALTAAAVGSAAYGTHKALQKWPPYDRAQKVVRSGLYRGATAVKNWIVSKMSSSGGKMDVVSIDTKTTTNPVQQVMGSGRVTVQSGSGVIDVPNIF